MTCRFACAALLLVAVLFIAVSVRPSLAQQPGSSSQPSSMDSTPADPVGDPADSANPTAPAGVTPVVVPSKTSGAKGKKYDKIPAAQGDHFPILAGVGITLAMLASLASVAFLILFGTGQKSALAVIKRQLKDVEARQPEIDQLLLQLPPQNNHIKTQLTNLENATEKQTKESQEAFKYLYDQIAATASSAAAQSASPRNDSRPAPNRSDPSTAPGSVTADQVRQMILPLQAKFDAHAANTTITLQSLENTRQGFENTRRDILQVLRSLTPSVPPKPSAPLPPPQPETLVDLISRAPSADSLTATAKTVQSLLDLLNKGSALSDAILNTLSNSIFEPLTIPLAPSGLTPAQSEARARLASALVQARQQAADLIRDRFHLEIMPITVRETVYDYEYHNAMRGTEMLTDLPDLNGKVAAVLQAGFLQRDSQGLTVKRKASVRLFRYEKPAPPPPAVELDPPAPIIEAQPVLAEPALTGQTPAGSETPASHAPEQEAAVLPSEEEAAPAVPSDDHGAILERLQSVAQGPKFESNSEATALAEDLTHAFPTQGEDLHAFLRETFGDKIRITIPELGAPYNPSYEWEGPQAGRVAEILRLGVEKDGYKALPKVRSEEQEATP